MQIREEVALKVARKAIASAIDPSLSVFSIKHKRVVAVEWKDVLQISAPSSDAPPVLKWKPSQVAALQLDKQQIIDEVNRRCAQRGSHEEWDG